MVRLLRSRSLSGIKEQIFSASNAAGDLGQIGDVRELTLIRQLSLNAVSGFLQFPVIIPETSQTGVRNYQTIASSGSSGITPDNLRVLIFNPWRDRYNRERSFLRIFKHSIINSSD
jgi:hypothetical protein